MYLCFALCSQKVATQDGIEEEVRWLSMWLGAEAQGRDDDLCHTIMLILVIV
jgi:hypothetical protein